MTCLEDCCSRTPPSGLGERLRDWLTLPHSWIALPCCGLIVPILTIPLLGIAARLRREPYSIGALRCLPTVGLRVVTILLLLYGGIAAETVRQEQAANIALERFLQHEGRYDAELTGQPWPE
jgi:hypothetical protein